MPLALAVHGVILERVISRGDDLTRGDVATGRYGGRYVGAGPSWRLTLATIERQENQHVCSPPKATV